MDMVQGYVNDMATGGADENQEDLTIAFLKFDFLKIIIDYEHCIICRCYCDNMYRCTTKPSSAILNSSSAKCTTTVQVPL